MPEHLTKKENSGIRLFYNRRIAFCLAKKIPEKRLSRKGTIIFFQKILHMCKKMCNFAGKIENTILYKPKLQ